MKILAVSDIKTNCGGEYQYTLIILDSVPNESLKNEFGEAFSVGVSKTSYSLKFGRLIVDNNTLKFFAYHSTGWKKNKSLFLDFLNKIIEKNGD